MVNIWIWIIVCVAVLFVLFCVLSHSAWWMGREASYEEAIKRAQRDLARRERREQERLRRVNGRVQD